MPSEVITQQRYAIVALKVKRGEMGKENLPITVRQMVEQLPTSIIHKIAIGKITEIVELKPLAKPKKVSPPPVVEEIAKTEPIDIHTPPPPEELVGALHDTVHKTKGKGRPAKSTKAKKKKSYTKPEVETEDVE